MPRNNIPVTGLCSPVTKNKKVPAFCRFFLLSAILLASFSFAHSQSPFSSNLPIVIIVTDTSPINDSVKIGATLQILYSNGCNTYCLDDTNNASLLNYNGRIAIKTRGHSSLLSPKKSFSIETRKADNVSNNNVALMGMPKENDWVLNALYLDNSHIRDALTFELGRRTGHYAPRTLHCELFINGEYQGLYLFSEKIKVDKNRVNITKMDPSDTSGVALTGGYIIKADKPDDDEPVAWYESSLVGSFDVSYIHHYPKPKDIAPQQHDYLHDYFNRFQRALRRNDTSFSTGYPALIDLPSFIDYMLVCEISSNSDSYQFSTFLHKNRNGKLCAGPLWDFNQAYGNDPQGRAGFDVWQFNNGSNTGSTFWNALFSRSFYHKKMESRWQQLTVNGPLSLDSLFSLIDSLAANVSQAALRDRLRWNNNSDFCQSIDSLKNWLSLRYAWLNEQLRPTDAILNSQLSTLDSQLSIFPNPTDGLLNIQLPDACLSSHATLAELFNSVGAKVMAFSITGISHSIDISLLPSGFYTLCLSTSDHQQWRAVFLKR